MVSKSENMALWASVSRTDPAATKNFQRSGGFRGTAISPMYLIQKATELWGPMGGKWGVRIVSEKTIEGAPLLHETLGKIGCEIVHQVQIELIYPEGTVPAFGQTLMVGRNKNGFYTDEDAPKKSLTDALTKALSWIGFAADVHMGLFDDVKYVEQTRKEFAEEKITKKDREAREKLYKETMQTLKASTAEGYQALAAAYKSLSDEAKSVIVREEVEKLKAEASAIEVSNAVA